MPSGGTDEAATGPHMSANEAGLPGPLTGSATGVFPKEGLSGWFMEWHFLIGPACAKHKFRAIPPSMAKKDKSGLPRFVPLDQVVPGQPADHEAEADHTDFTMLKCKCLKCGLHFMLCTWYPERHSDSTIFCPECGQRGEGMLLWQEYVNQPISETVPGGAQLVQSTLPRRSPRDH